MPLEPTSPTLSEVLQHDNQAARIIADALPNLVWISDPTGMPIWFNQRWDEYIGRTMSITPEEYRGRLSRIAHPDDAVRVRDAWERALAEGSAFESECRYHGADGVYRWFLLRSVPTYTASGELQQWIGTATNIDRQKRSEARLRFLVEASEHLSASLDTRRTLQELAALAVPRIADWCSVSLLTPDGSLESIAIVHEDPAMIELAEYFTLKYPLEDSPSTKAVLQTRKSVFVPVVTPEMLAMGARDAEYLRIVNRLQIGSVIMVAIANDRRVFGILNLVCATSNYTFDASDLQLAEALAISTAGALEKARLFEREHQASRAFQRAALPKSLPQIPGLTFAEVYEPSETEALIGGDWYDALRLGDGRIVISIGDVAGSGLQAAVIMASMRQVIRGVAQIYADPKTMIDAADKSLKAEHESCLVTAFVAVYDPVARSLAYTNAGHPPPFLRHADGRVQEVEEVGLPLGLRQRNDGETIIIEIPHDSTLILYTDGLIESKRDVPAGLANLAAALRNPATFLAANTARAIYDSMLEGKAADDVVVFTVRFDQHDGLDADVDIEPVDAVKRSHRWKFSSDDVPLAQRARLECAERLSEYGMSDDEVFSAELVFGELLSNVVRYAPGEVEIILDVTDGKHVILHFIDGGQGFVLIPALPSDLLSETGRGLFLIWTIAEEFNVTKHPHGGSHARVVLSRVAFSA